MPCFIHVIINQVTLSKRKARTKLSPCTYICIKKKKINVHCRIQLVHIIAFPQTMDAHIIPIVE